MSIRCICPNGHPLSVNNALAGRSGLCPRCRAPVRVPQLPVRRVSEDAILDILGPQAPISRIPAEPEGERDGAAPRFEVHEHTTPPKKTCYRCNQEISAGTHICPHCHTYIASLHDF